MSIKYAHRASTRLRLASGLSMGDAARLSRLTERTIAYIEKGYSDPKATTLAKLAHAYGVSVEAFYALPRSKAV